MTCLCAANTLRVFVHSIAHFDVLSPTATIRGRSAVNGLYGRRQVISGTRRSLHCTAGRFDAAKSIQSVKTEGLEERNEGRDETQSSKEQGGNEADIAGSAFAEMSMESINALAAEISAERGKSGESQSKMDSGTGSAETDAGESGWSRKFVFRKVKIGSEDSGLDERGSRMRRRETRESNATDNGRGEHAATEPSEKKDTKKYTPREHWQIDKQALKEKFPEGWNPRKRLSPDALAGIRALHASMPTAFTTEHLAQRFEVSPEAIRRILKSKWVPNAEEETDRQRRWFERGKKVYEEAVKRGDKVPKRWREVGIGAGYMKKRREKLRERVGMEGMREGPPLVTTARRPVRTSWGGEGWPGMSRDI